jgi:protease-4
MSESPDFFTELTQELQALWRQTADGWSALQITLLNQIRAVRSRDLDYIVMPIGGSFPERDAPPRSFIERQLPLPTPSLSLETLNRRFQAIADADNVKGVVLIFRGLSAGMASIQNLRRSIERLRQSGKEVIVYTPYLDMSHYYAATAADRIIVPPTAIFDVLGLHLEVMFYKDALARVGLQMDVVQISPYKTALDPFGQTDMTPQMREQLSWILDERFDMFTADMANGRHKTQDEIKQLIDQAPHFPEAILEAGLIDHIAYEDELAYILAASDTETTAEEAESTSENQPEAETKSAESKRPKARLMTWREAHNLLTEKPRSTSKKYIGVVSLEGNIIMGTSRQPPIDIPLPFVGGEMAGEETIVQLLRQVEQDDNMAALIFHVDSGGGSALASDLIGQQIKRIRHKKPVLVYMGNAAASGGYYVSAAAQHIMCQPGTITGSIGVINGRLSTKGLYAKASLNTIALERGEHIGLYHDNGPMSEEQRQIFWDAISEMYRQFKMVVANGRSLDYDDLDSICEGRVWTGRQAQTHKLVDSFGDFVDAVHTAAELAELPTDDDHAIPVVNIYARHDEYHLPKPYEAAEEIAKWLLGEQLKEWNGRPLLLMPYHFKF